MRRLVHLLLLLAWMTLPPSAVTQDLTVRASASPTMVSVGEPVTYMLAVTGVPIHRIETPESPEATGLVLRTATPVTQTSYTYTNGTLRREVTFQWRYRSTRTGTARFEPAHVTVAGEAYHTASITLRVLPPPAGAATHNRATPLPDSSGTLPNRSDDLFIRAEAGKQQPYVGEQVVITYRLYFREGLRLRGSRLAGAWNAPGFWREELDVAARPVPRPFTIDGRSYQAFILKRAAFFPTQAGSLHVAPLHIETEVVESMLSQYLPWTGERVEVASRPVMLHVRPLPDGAPDSFEGAVGTFQMTARMNPANVAAGEAVQLRVRISGRGNLPLLRAPTLDVPASIEVYDAAAQLALDRDGERLSGSKTFTYTLVPKRKGAFRLPPVTFAHLDPESGQYRTIQAHLPTLRVTEAPAAPPATGLTSEGLPVGVLADPLLGAARWTRTDAPPLHARPWVWAVLLGPALLAGGVLAYRRWHIRRAERPVPAHTRARRHLHAADAARQAGEWHHFFEEIERALLDMTEHLLGASAHGLTRQQLMQRLAHAGVAPPMRETLDALLDACDRARFVPGASGLSPDDVYTRAQSLVDDLGAHLDGGSHTSSVRSLSLFLAFTVGVVSGCVPGNPAEAPPPVHRAFEEGNRLYAKGHYEAARRAYEEALSFGYDSGALYYNLGGAYAHTGRLGQALRYYEKARALLPKNERLRHNLHLIRSRLDLPPASTRLPLWQTAGQWITHRLPSPTLFWLGFFSYFVGLCLWTYHRWIATPRRGFRTAAGTALLVGALLLSLGFAASAELFTPSRAVVVTGSGVLRPAPTVAADTSAHLAEGAVLDVLEHRPEWTRVRLPNKTTGWIDARTLGEI